jgi:hypothetical protein
VRPARRGGDAVDEDAVFQLDDRDRLFCRDEFHPTFALYEARRTNGT